MIYPNYCPGAQRDYDNQNDDRWVEARQIATEMRAEQEDAPGDETDCETDPEIQFRCPECGRMTINNHCPTCNPAGV